MRKILIEKNYIKDIPYMMFYKEGLENAPFVIIAHGFDNNKYEGSELAIRLAESGFAALTFDLYKQGERYDGFLEEIQSDVEIGYKLYEIVKESNNDIDEIIKYFETDSRINSNRIGMAGISLGANLCYYSLTKNDEIKVSVPLLGSPKFEDLLLYMMEKETVSDITDEKEKELLKYVKDMDPYKHLREYENRALLMINGTKDDNVPAKFAEEFYCEVAERYKGENRAIEVFVADEFHYVSNEMKNKTIDWFKKHL